jgi:hypothetical protein
MYPHEPIWIFRLTSRGDGNYSPSLLALIVALTWTRTTSRSLALAYQSAERTTVGVILALMTGGI